MDFGKLLLSPRGRIGRGRFWIGFLVIMAASLALNLIPGEIGRWLGFVLLWPQICINFKRLHDMGKSGWLLLIPAAVSIVCLALSFVLGSGAEAYPNQEALAPLAAAGAFSLAFLLWVGLSPGKPGANRFGPSPQGAGG